MAQPEGHTVGTALERADVVTTSDLTLLECDRALIRGVATGVLAQREAAPLRVVLARTAARWRLMPITAGIVERARRPFPAEPIRSLDALHLSSALLIATTVGEVGLLSLDRRVRATAGALGFHVVPG